jgi:hypothetical protein
MKVGSLSPLERLSKRQREATPEAFARHLVRRVAGLFGTPTVAVLWVQERSVYHGIEGCDCWPASRDANGYAGPWPIIAHPPCGPWGKYRARCGQDPACGVRAMELVERWGAWSSSRSGLACFANTAGGSASAWRGSTSANSATRR